MKNDPNSFQSDNYLHFSSEEELRDDFGFLNIIELYEYFHKNYANDIEYHKMWILVVENLCDKKLSYQLITISF